MSRCAGAGGGAPVPISRLDLALALTLLLGACLSGCQPTPDESSLPPLEASVKINGQRELVVGEDGSLTPVFIGPEKPLHLCFETEEDTSSWEVRWSLAGEAREPAQPMEPGRRWGGVACFQGALPKQHDPAQPLTVCWRVHDQYLNQRYRRECKEIEYRPRDPGFDRLIARSGEVLMDTGLDPREQARAIEALSREAFEQGYPDLGVQIRIIAVSSLRRLGEMEEAVQLVDHLPAWIDHPEAANTGSLAKVERAQVYIESGWRIQEAWTELRDAEALMRSIVSKHRPTVAMQDAEILAQVGALQDAIQRLEDSIASCHETTAPCAPNALAAAKSQLYWNLPQQPDADPEALARAIEEMEAMLATRPENYPALELANDRINLAYLRVTQGKDGASDLRQARELLAEAPAGSAENVSRARRLSAWVELVSGLSALAAGEINRASARCSALADIEEFPRLAAWASSCAGQAYRRRGDARAALAAFEKALALHRYASPRQLGQQINQRPGQRAEDFYRAARAAVEIGDTGLAWSLLVQLDDLATDEQLHSLCRERANDPSAQALWDAWDSKRQALLSQLIRQQGPSAGTRARDLATSNTRLRQELQQLYRNPPGCADLMEARSASSPQTTGWRIAALEDEVLLLHRSPSGSVESVRRPAHRRELRRIVARLDRELADRTIGNEEWRALLTPLAKALIPPRPDSLPAVTRFALHGFLQDVPMAALPLEGGEERWLADVTTPALQPAVGGSPRPAATPAPATSGLFVVDPTSNLPSGPRMAQFYQREFPEARMLHGKSATVRGVSGSLAGVTFLHLDTHGQFNRVFPELSSLQFADGAMDLPTLAQLPTPPLFANLSACESGRWPTTADAGRFGIAGVFARRGTAWVIASRAVIGDSLSQDFNQAFYRALRPRRLEVSAVPAAYGEALAHLRSAYSATEWANLFLLIGRENQLSRGQRASLSTPGKAEAVPLARDQRTNRTVYAKNAEPFDAIYRF